MLAGESDSDATSHTYRSIAADCRFIGAGNLRRVLARRSPQRLRSTQACKFKELPAISARRSCLNVPVEDANCKAMQWSSRDDTVNKRS